MVEFGLRIWWRSLRSCVWHSPLTPCGLKSTMGALQTNPPSWANLKMERKSVKPCHVSDFHWYFSWKKSLVKPMSHYRDIFKSNMNYCHDRTVKITRIETWGLADGGFAISSSYLEDLLPSLVTSRCFSPISSHSPSVSIPLTGGFCAEAF